MRLGILILAMVWLVASHTNAQSVRSEVIASNGVTVTVHTDEFAGRYEYTSPEIEVADGYAFVARIEQGGAAGDVQILGGFVYSGEWRYYQSAVFRGGDPADFTARDRDVGRCSSSRYSRPSCTLTETWGIKLTAEQIQQHAVDGLIPIQLRAVDSSANVIIQVPVASLEAIREVSSRPH